VPDVKKNLLEIFTGFFEDLTKDLWRVKKNLLEIFTGFFEDLAKDLWRV